MAVELYLGFPASTVIPGRVVLVILGSLASAEARGLHRDFFWRSHLWKGRTKHLLGIVLWALGPFPQTSTPSFPLSFFFSSLRDEFCTCVSSGRSGQSHHQRRVNMGVRKRFFTRGWWAWNRATAPSCLSSRSIWTLLSDTGFEFWVVLRGAVLSDHRITVLQGLEGTPGDHLVQPPC